MKNLQHYALILLLSFLTASAIAQTRSISDFDAIKTSGNVNVKLVKADSPSIEYKMIAGNENDLITEVKNNTLTVKIKNKTAGPLPTKCGLQAGTTPSIDWNLMI